MKTAVIFGVTGQDGSYLTELLLTQEYKVYGVARRVSTTNDGRLQHIKDHADFTIVQGDVTDSASVNAIIAKLKPDEVYNLAAQSHVRVSFDEPLHTFDVTARGAFKILEAIRQLSPKSKYYQAGSSEMFGASRGKSIGNNHYMQDESTPFEPRSPYAVAKVAAHHMTKIYRDAYGVFACNGILFNHESERRGGEFVTRKVTQYLAKAHLYLSANFAERAIWSATGAKAFLGDYPPIKLGNLEAYRDLGHAEDFVRAMWLMLQQDTPDDYVIATGETHSIQEFVVKAFNKVLGYYSTSLVETDPSLFRPTEVNYLCGNYTKAKTKLGWEPHIKFNELVDRMLLSDINAERRVYNLRRAEFIAIENMLPSHMKHGEL